MKENKFRGWDGSQFWHYSIGNSTCTTEGDCGVESLPINEVDIDEWEQYTGSKDDDNGKIYEDDVFTALLDNGDKEGRKKYRVAFMNGSYYGFPLFETESMYEYEFLDSLCGKKIIGNIHENPELLEIKNG